MVSYTYDALGRIQKRSVGLPEGSEVETTYTYVPNFNDATTPLIQTISQNGMTLTYAYDDNGILLAIILKKNLDKKGIDEYEWF